MIRRKLPVRLVTNYALRISLIYVLIGVTYLLTSNYILYNTIYDGNFYGLSLIHNFKGISFILLTSIILYLIIRNYEIRIKSYMILLNKQNQQLKDYAFHTSHHLRRPLVNLMGLHNLIERQNYSYHELKRKISISLTELDAIVHETNDILKIDDGV